MRARKRPAEINGLNRTFTWIVVIISKAELIQPSLLFCGVKTLLTSVIRGLGDSLNASTV
jgi:hypothetical protein